MKADAHALTSEQHRDLYWIISQKARDEFSLIKQDFDFLKEGYENLNHSQFLNEYGQKIRDKQNFCEYAEFLTLLELLDALFKNLKVKFISLD